VAALCGILRHTSTREVLGLGVMTSLVQLIKDSREARGSGLDNFSTSKTSKTSDLEILKYLEKLKTDFENSTSLTRPKHPISHPSLVHQRTA
jgi:hypothetical protein